MKHLLVMLIGIAGFFNCSDSKKNGMDTTGGIAGWMLLLGSQSSVSSAAQTSFPSSDVFVKIHSDKTFVIYGASGSGVGTFVYFSGHKHEFDIGKVSVEKLAEQILSEHKKKFARIIYISYALGEKVEDRFEKIYPELKKLISGKVTLFALSAGNLYAELLKDRLQKEKIEIENSIAIAGIKKGILLSGYESLKAALGVVAEGIEKAAPELAEYLGDSDFIKNLQNIISKNAKQNSFCIAMDFFNTGTDTVTSVDSACAGVAPANRVRIAGDHNVNENPSLLTTVSKAVGYILEKNSVPSAENSLLSMLPLYFDTAAGQFVPGTVPNLANTSVSASFVNNVPGLSVSAMNGDWDISLSAKLSTINLEKNLISLSGYSSAKNAKTGSYFFAQNLTGEIVYNMDYYKLAGGSGRPSGFDLYPYYLSSNADFAKQSPIAMINIMDVSAPVHFYGASIGIKDHKNFKVSPNIAGHWYKYEQIIFVPIVRTIDISTNALSITYVNGLPSITGSLRLDGYGLGLDNIKTDCIFIEAERNDKFIRFTSPQQIRADLIGISIAQTSCSALIGGDITLQIIK